MCIRDRYIGDLIAEVHAAGFDQVLLENVRFPSSTSAKQDYGNTNGVDRAGQLTADIAAWQARFGDTVTLWYGYSLAEVTGSSSQLGAPAAQLGVKNLLVKVPSSSTLDAAAREELTLSLRQDVSAKLNRLPLRYFDGHKTGDIMSRVTNDLEKVSSVMQVGLMQLVSSVFTIALAAAAMVSSWMMTVANVPAIVTSILAPFIEHPTLLMLVTCGIVLLVGTSMDVTPTIMILTPVLMPAVKAAGINTGYFGVVFILMCVLGLLTPPVGTVLNVACGAGKINMERMVKAVWPFLLAEVIILLLMILFPATVIVPMNFFTGG